MTEQKSNVEEDKVSQILSHVLYKIYIGRELTSLRIDKGTDGRGEKEGRKGANMSKFQ